MIVLALLVASLQQSPLYAEREALMNQQSRRLGEATTEMSFALGECASVYPMGQSDPAVRRARASVRQLNHQGVQDELQRTEALGYALGLERARSAVPGVGECAVKIADTAAYLTAVADGMRDLVRRLSQ